ncbi:hypothetical protein [Acaryochloris sp. CCMEE 5410]|uniref:hypothetical protein n=1 Tax=Acaryochloris sp. CCMEE 5410 TaxID=310037 RepID=UPI0006835B30|nr:hypothetical protein [Acaryochloris sp. CCMEE 5410]KAI9130599.1 hypothetical protein ON05_022725 [Acaryochloris sp. CCMEE 5410]
MVRYRQLLASEDPAWTYVSGKLRSGYGVASGRAVNSPYPEGTIALQTPYFKELGLDLTPYYPGTLNISIAPAQFQMIQPQWTFPLVHWYPASCPETFSFSPCQVKSGDHLTSGLIYYPHPETKPKHFQEPSLIEVLAPFIPQMKTGMTVALGVLSQQVEIFEPEP